MKTKDDFSEGAKVTQDNQIFAGGAGKNRKAGSDRGNTSGSSEQTKNKQ
ncbi:hypothetical protein [Peribacillus glennii]|nr:hypothetical protein [Peribacillus glennii]